MSLELRGDLCGGASSPEEADLHIEAVDKNEGNDVASAVCKEGEDKGWRWICKIPRDPR